MVEVDTGIGEADGDAGAGAAGPRLLGPDLREPPLAGAVRIVRRAGDVRQGPEERCECDEGCDAEDD